jgi:hypothetical protein
MDRLRILTWHVHGSYLAALAHLPHEIVLPVRPDAGPGWDGLGVGRSWPPNVVAVPADEVQGMAIDVVLLQSARNYEEDQHLVVDQRHRNVPRIFLEHDPPRGHPTDTRHHVDDPDVLVVHVSHFNRLMWDAGRSPTTVVEHAVAIPEDVRWTGEIERGITAINELRKRGRRLGADIFEAARASVPLDLVGMDSIEMGGLGEIPPEDLPAYEARYRFYFSPVRYTSLPLAVMEAMHVGLPIVALATTEIPVVIEDGVTGFIATDPARLIDRMRDLLADRQRFGIERFVRDWDAIVRDVADRPVGRTHPGIEPRLTAEAVR